MKVNTLILLLIIISCGKKELKNSIVLPANQASREEAALVMSAVDKIQTDFDELGVNINLRLIPYHVTTLDSNVAGICAYRADGSPIGIAISHEVIKNWSIEDNENFGLLYKVLLHEIGHCFFERAHESNFFDIPGFLMLLNDHEHHVFAEDQVEKSVMNVGGQAMIPKALWPYYVKEVAGLDRINSLEDLERYVEVELMRL